jgi:hypothetical protein
MAITPATYNIRPQRRADFPLTVRFKDSEGATINLTGWDILAQVWSKDRTTKYGDFTVTVDTPATGEAQLLLPYTITEALPTEARYDVMLINGDGLREYYLEGIVRPSEGYTTPD